ncbi:alpha/beta hydrolase [Saccharopolyspora erythraea]|uniref:alpha/beta fold hydrolase n=1 Tax=Saccharopolyspora erythraea TaxID=1836 RepID=UPI001BA4C40B|nr:alpha/beta hydrolase [Saccharopolyspora erythraea]QUH03199.1 alpha/beta hydrolase [Saccharopolyspora erythraea]
MATFVLVPGFWLGAWAWDDVARDLRAAGHDVHPVTLTGLAERASEATPQVDVDTHIDDIISVIRDEDLHEVVLVGHSGGSIPVTGVGDRIPERLARIVYVDSGPLPDGMAQIDFHDTDSRQELQRQVSSEGGGWKIPVPPFDPATDADNLAGLGEKQLRRMRELGTPQPFGTAGQPLRRPQTTPDTPKSAIMCTFPPEVVRSLADSGNPVFAPMADLDLHHLPTGHWPMFSRPADLAALLSKLA